MQGYSYNVDAGDVAAMTALGLASLFKPVDPAAPAGDQVIPSITPGALVNKAMDLAGVPIRVTVSQIDNTVLFTDGATNTANAVPNAIPSFATA